MNLRFTATIAALTLLMLSAAGEYTFKDKSALAAGKWVKIEIGETGLYSISYDQLREMGFTTPEKVGVYGKGGRLLNLQFSPSSAAADGLTYSDDLNQITSLHNNNNLIFWGEGLENVSFNTGSTTSAIPYFENFRQNIYSNSTYYFLSDTEEPLAPEEAAVTAKSFLTLANGWGFVRHELDLEYNTTRTGKLFWGESFVNDSPAKSWKVRVSNMTEGISHLSYLIFSAPETQASLLTKCSSGNAEKQFTMNYNNTDYFHPVKGRLSADPYKNSLPDTLRFANKKADEVEISISVADINSDFMNLDYWLLTYPKEIKADPLSDDLSYELYHFKTTKKKSYKLPLKPGLCAWDMTDTHNALRLPYYEDEEKVAFTMGNTAAIPILIFDPSRIHKQIIGWEDVKNNDLHSLAMEGNELLIVTVPRFKQYAEQLADLHRKYDGIKVTVATPEEIYNEFSGGVPDPTAYRAAGRCFYLHGLKNMLLLGPSMRDMRTELQGETWRDRHIAYQHSYVRPSEEGVPAFDLYAVMRDNVIENSLQAEAKNIGVGILSCESEEECERIIRKIEKYLTSDDYAWIVNETMSIGGTGNEHTHDQMAVDAGEFITTSTGKSGIVHNTLVIDAYGNTKARDEFFNLLDRGKIWNIYFGHGGSWSLGSDDFFTTGDLYDLRNHRPGFIFMGGCDFSTPGIRVRGIGENLILNTGYGMMAGIVSTRTAYSGQNKQLANKFVTSWLKPDDISKSPTIGEIFAQAKSNSSHLNDLCFILAGDPALKVPSPVDGIELQAPSTAAPGEKIIIKGNVLSPDGNKDNNFNGKVVIKLMEPPVTLRSQDYDTNTCRTPINGASGTYYSTVDVPYESTLVSAMESDVSNGEFELEFVIPANASSFTGKNMTLKAGAFDKTVWIGGSGATELSITENPREDAEIDSDAPTVIFEYNNTRGLLSVSVSDDGAIPLVSSAYTITVDGIPCAIIPIEYATQNETASRFEGYCDVMHLSDGIHEVIISASDLAGNTVEVAYSFEKTPVEPPISLTLKSKVAVESLEVTVAGEFSGNLEVEIKDASGKVVHSFNTQSDEFEWDLSDKSGNRLPEGYYNICVRDISEMPVKYSENKEFAIL